MIRLRGMAFDHPRAIDPMQAAGRRFSVEHEVEISWDARSLEDFEDYPLEKLVDQYDLIMIDHPFVGTGAKKGALVRLDEHVAAECLADQMKNSVGPSYDSYSWEGHQWALAVDAAAQVSAYRPDLLAGSKVPEDWKEVFTLAKTLPAQSGMVVPLNPTHAFCSLLTLCANIGGHGFWNEAGKMDPVVGEEALDVLRRLMGVADERSLGMDPIRVLDLMSRGNDVAYAPLIFGYSNYARPGFAKHAIRFADIPSTQGEPAGAVLGGVGLAISASSNHKQAAVEYALYVAGEACQKGLYFANGGQPGYRTAWTDEGLNERSDNFFKNTLRTVDLAYLRPRHAGFPSFQKSAAATVHRFLRGAGTARETVRDLNRLDARPGSAPGN